MTIGLQGPCPHFRHTQQLTRTRFGARVKRTHDML
jgi:hypothetical protein